MNTKICTECKSNFYDRMTGDRFCDWCTKDVDGVLVDRFEEE